MTVTFTLSVLQVNNNLINKYKIEINNNKITIKMKIFMFSNLCYVH